MAKISEATLVEDKDYKNLHLSNDNNLYGDLFYYLKGGVVFIYTIHGYYFTPLTLARKVYVVIWVISFNGVIYVCVTHTNFLRIILLPGTRSIPHFS